ncbi:MAG: hypothetical protein K6B13_11170 [Prevotella sp.]|nr:hypothetical protein [Prevotella sp.]
MKKLVKKTRGSAAIFDDDSIEFTPQGVGEPKYEAMCKVGQSHISRTLGAEIQSYVAHLKVDGNEADPVEVMHEQIDRLAQKIWPATTREPKVRGKVLYDRNGMTARCDAKRGVLSFHLDIDMRSAKCDYISIIVKALTEFQKCLSINETYLKRVYRALANSLKQ